MKKLLLILSLCVILQMPVSAQEFADVSPENWFYPYVTTMVEQGLIGGYDDGTFKPENTLTLAEFSAMLSNAFYGTSLQIVQSEVFEQWWEPFVYSSYLRGGLSGTSIDLEIQDYFQRGYLFNRWDSYVTQPLTRYDMAAMVYNILLDRYVPTCSATQAEPILLSISDVAPDSPYALALATCYEAGLVTGSKGEFRGEDTLNRAEAAVVLCSLVNYPLVELEPYTAAIDTLSSPDYNLSSFQYTGHLALENYVFARVNQLRATLGLNQLTSNDTLVTYAYTRSKETEIYWSHTRPDGSSWSTVIDSDDTENILTGENLTMGSGFSYYEFGDMIFKSWLNSPGHYANMINPIHQELGLAIYVNQSGAYYATQIFGKPANP